MCYMEGSVFHTPYFIYTKLDCTAEVWEKRNAQLLFAVVISELYFYCGI